MREFLDLLAFLLLQYVAFAFGVAFWVHVRDRDRLEKVVRHATGTQSTAAPVVILAVDGVIAVGLVVVPLGGSAAALTYLTMITAYYALRTRRGVTIPDCGCSGTAKPVDSDFFSRNSLLIVSAAIVVFGYASGGGVPLTWNALTSVTLVMSFVVANRQLRRSMGGAIEPPPALDITASRRSFLRLASAALGGGAFLVSRPVQALALRSSHSDKIKRSASKLSGAAAQGPIGDVIASFPTLAEVDRLVPGAKQIEWRGAIVSSVERGTAAKHLVYTKVVAPIIGSGRELVGILVRATQGETSRGSGSHANFEERVQLVWPHGEQQKTVLLSPDGSYTTESRDAIRKWPATPKVDGAQTVCGPPLLTCIKLYTEPCQWMCACEHVDCCVHQVCVTPHPTDPIYLKECGCCAMCSDTPCPPLCGCPVGLPCCCIFGIGCCDGIDCLIEIETNCISNTR
ncbi:MAG: hypothetical protein M3134_01945 [Actinomycetota bacterium]|nr:hypothetical protein [Actinomycetota bacterium]